MSSPPATKALPAQKAKQLQQLRRFLIPVVIKRTTRTRRLQERLAIRPCPPYRAAAILRIMLECGNETEEKRENANYSAAGSPIQTSSNSAFRRLVQVPQTLIPTWPEDIREGLLKGCAVKYKLPREILVYRHEPSTVTGVMLLICGDVVFTDHPHDLSGPNTKLVSGPAVLCEDWAATESPAPQFVISLSAVDVVYINHGTFKKVAFYSLPTKESQVFEHTYMVRRQLVMAKFFPQTPPLMRLCWICSDFPPSVLEKLIGALKPISFMPGRTIVAEGTYSPFMYFLRRGEVAIYSRGQDTRRRLLPGACFGENSFLFGEKRGATCKAVSPVDVWELHSKTIREIFHNESIRQDIITKAANIRRKWLGDQKSLATNPLRKVLKDIPCLAHCSIEARDHLVDVSRPVVFPAGTLITSTSEQCDGIYVLVNGSAKSQRKLGTGDIAAFEGTKKDFFGDWCLYHHRWPYSIAAMSIVEAWFLSSSAIKRVLSQYGEYEGAKASCVEQITAYRRKNGPESILLGGASTRQHAQILPPKLKFRKQPTKLFVTPDQPTGPVSRKVAARNRRAATLLVRDDDEFEPIQLDRENLSPERTQGSKSARRKPEEKEPLTQPPVEERIDLSTAGDGATSVVQQLASQPSFAHRGFLTSLQRARQPARRIATATKMESSSILDPDLFADWSINPEDTGDGSESDGSSDCSETHEAAQMELTAAKFQPEGRNGYACRLPSLLIKQQQERSAASPQLPSTFMPTIDEAESMMEDVFRYSVKETIDIEGDGEAEDSVTDFLEEAWQELLKPRRKSVVAAPKRPRQDAVGDNPFSAQNSNSDRHRLVVVATEDEQSNNEEGTNQYSTICDAEETESVTPEESNETKNRLRVRKIRGKKTRKEAPAKPSLLIQPPKKERKRPEFIPTMPEKLSRNGSALATRLCVSPRDPPKREDPILHNEPVEKLTTPRGDPRLEATVCERTRNLVNPAPPSRVAIIPNLRRMRNGGIMVQQLGSRPASARATQTPPPASVVSEQSPGRDSSSKHRPQSCRGSQNNPFQLLSQADSCRALYYAKLARTHRPSSGTPSKLPTNHSKLKGSEVQK